MKDEKQTCIKLFHSSQSTCYSFQGDRLLLKWRCRWKCSFQLISGLIVWDSRCWGHQDSSKNDTISNEIFSQIWTLRLSVEIGFRQTWTIISLNFYCSHVLLFFYHFPGHVIGYGFVLLRVWFRMFLCFNCSNNGLIGWYFSKRLKSKL
jgi:hypothetical protein